MPFLHPWKISNRTSCDVIVRFDGEIVKFPCSKSLLCQASPRFKETLSAKNGQVIITKMSPETVSIMLRFINKEILEPMPTDTLLDLLKGAIFYEVTKLITACSKKLELKLDLSNAGMLLELASMNSLPSLYEASLKVCVEAAFYMMDSRDFNDLLPSTVMAIVSEENLQVPNETFVLYCLWIRATVEVCRSDLELTLPNIAKFFEPFSVYVEFGDVDEDWLASYGNPYLVQYFRRVKGSRNFRIFPTQRGMSFPLSLPNNSYVCYKTSNAEGLGISSECCIAFQVKASVYLIEFRLACSGETVDELILEGNSGVLLTWNSVQGGSNINLSSQKQSLRFPKGEMPFIEFQVSVNSLVKLHRTKMYRLQFKSRDNKWPIMKKEANPYIDMLNRTSVGLTKMTLLPSPPIE